MIGTTIGILLVRRFVKRRRLRLQGNSGIEPEASESALFPDGAFGAMKMFLNRMKKFLPGNIVP